MDQREIRACYDNIKDGLSRLITANICNLLGNKHLYQKIEIDTSKLMVKASLMSKSSNAIESLNGTRCLQILGYFWRFDKQAGVPMPNSAGNLESIDFALPTVKLYCSTCDRVEPFNALSPRVDSILNHVVNAKMQQVFILEYECQSCKGFPMVFIVRREGMKLFLEGRSPIERFDVPKAIPKEQRKYYSDAIVACNSGQTLAGLFLLRTFIEQYLRNTLPNSDERADDLLQAYMDSLPIDFKNRFPSLSKLYEDLSCAIHSADASEELFKKSIDNLNEHFEAKKLFKI